MDVADPRAQYDDLVAEHRAEDVDAKTFEAMGDNEAFSVGWVTIGLALDDDGRVLLVYDDDAEQWVVPGGSVQPGETLQESVVREVREESGVPVEPQRPHAVVDHQIYHDGRTRSFSVVAYEVRPTSTAVGDDLGVDDENIVAADWFESLPDATFERTFAARVLNRIRSD